MVLAKEDVLESACHQLLELERLARCTLVEQQQGFLDLVFLAQQIEAVQERLAGGVAADKNGGLARLLENPLQQTQRMKPHTEICLYGAFR